MRTLVVSAAAAAALIASPGSADEIWNSDQVGRVIYEVDVDDVAVFSFDSVLSDERAFLYIPGLPGSLDNRGNYAGYWIDPTGEGDCMAELVGADGVKSKTWGAATISWEAREFPSAFVVEFGNCFGGDIFSISATPTTGP